MGVKGAVSTGSWPGVRPPSSAYCCHRSASINSAAARNERIAMSPRVGVRICAEAVLLATNPAPTVAVPASRLFLRNERRFAGSDNCFTPICFKSVLLESGICTGRSIENVLAPKRRVLDSLWHFYEKGKSLQQLYPAV